jgi:hypothetical protein
MNYANPFDLFLLAALAGAGFTLGASLVQSIASHINLYLTRRLQEKASNEALARLKEGAAVREEAAAKAESAQQSMRREAAKGFTRETFPVIAEPGRS